MTKRRLFHITLGALSLTGAGLAAFQVVRPGLVWAAVGCALVTRLDEILKAREPKMFPDDEPITKPERMP